MTDATETARKLLELAEGVPQIYPRYLAYIAYIQAANPAAVTQLATAYLEAQQNFEAAHDLANQWMELEIKFEQRAEAAETALTQERAKVAELRAALEDADRTLRGLAASLFDNDMENQAKTALNLNLRLLNADTERLAATAPDTEPA